MANTLGRLLQKLMGLAKHCANALSAEIFNLAAESSRHPHALTLPLTASARLLKIRLRRGSRASCEERVNAYHLRWLVTARNVYLYKVAAWSTNDFCPYQHPLSHF